MNYFFDQLFALKVQTERRLLIGCAVASLLLLFGMISYPMGYDQSVFAVGGEMILKHGAVPYRDFLDTKPPLIFYLYALAHAVFGHHIYSIRLFDAIYIGATFYLWYRILSRIFQSRSFAAITAFITLLQYVAFGFWMTAQAESFAFLPTFLLFWLTFEARDKSKRAASIYGSIAGVLTIILFLLKFTLVATPFACIILILFVKSYRSIRWSYLAGWLFSTVAFLGLFVYWQSANEALVRMNEGLTWLSDYAAIQPLFSRETLSLSFYQFFPQQLIFSFTPAFFILGLFGVANIARAKNEGKESSRKLPMTLFLVVFFLNILSVLYERKFFPYHFLRAFWAFAPFVTIALFAFVRWMRSAFSALSSLSERTLAVILIVFILFFSSLPQVISQPVTWTLLNLRHANIGVEVQHRQPEYFYAEQQQLADSLRPMLNDTDQVFFWGNDVGVYYFLNRLPTTICLTNTPLRTRFTPLSWKLQMLDQLRRDPPRFVIVERDDAKSWITGSTLDSFQAMLEWKGLQGFIYSGYSETLQLPHFIVFERRA